MDFPVRIVALVLAARTNLDMKTIYIMLKCLQTIDILAHLKESQLMNPHENVLARNPNVKRNIVSVLVLA